MNTHVQAIEDALEVLNPESLLYIRLNEAKNELVRLQQEQKETLELMVYPQGSMVSVGSSAVGDVTVKVTLPDDIPTMLGASPDDDEDEVACPRPPRKKTKPVKICRLDPDVNASSGMWSSSRTYKAFLENLKTVECSDAVAEGHTKSISRCYKSSCKDLGSGRSLDLGNSTWYSVTLGGNKWTWKGTLRHAVEHHNYKPSPSFITFINHLARSVRDDD